MLILKATLILAAWGLCWLLRRGSAATRQLVWTSALSAALLLPLFSVAVPPVRPKISTRVAVVTAAVDRMGDERPTPGPFIFSGVRGRVPVTDQLALPVAWGLFRPLILLPTAALEWPPERLRLVIAHEKAHIRRGDFLGQVAAQLACAVYWFHPLACGHSSS